ncbi:MAG: hypothetical protein ACRDYU_13655 [Actinomycetes bacterium]
MLYSAPGRHRRPKKTLRAVAVPVVVALPLLGSSYLPAGVQSALPWADDDEGNSRLRPTARAGEQATPPAFAAARTVDRASRMAERGEPLLAADARTVAETPSPKPTKTHKPEPKPTRTEKPEPTATPTPTRTRTPEPEPTKTEEPKRVRYGASVADAKAYAKSVLSAAEWDALDRLARHESSWDKHAENPTSGAYGIPQALPPEKMATAGPDWRDNATTQVKWMINYCEERYGGTIEAWDFWQANNWY